MRKELLATINKAIDNAEKLVIEIHAGISGMRVECNPDGVDEGSSSVVIYAGNDLYSVDISDVSWDEDEDKFICNNEHCAVSISKED